ncbi:Programmed cell death 7 [Chamberlinius hualienensis]
MNPDFVQSPSPMSNNFVYQPNSEQVGSKPIMPSLNWPHNSMPFPFYSTVAPPPPPPPIGWNFHYQNLPPPPPPNLHLQLQSQTPISYQGSWGNALQSESNFSATSIQNRWNVNADISGVKTEVVQRDKDQNFINDFMAKTVDKKSVPKHHFKIHVAMNLFHQVIQLTNRLKILHSTLTTTEDDNNDKEMSESKTIMEKIKTIFQQISPDELTGLKKAISKRKAKRKRLQIIKSENKKRNEERQNQLQILHDKIDARLNAVKQELQTAEMERKMKHEADMILSEVRKKKSEANKALNMIEASDKLRSVRKERKRSLYTPTAFDEHLRTEISALKQILISRLADYDEEEKTLQVMLTEEHQETRKTAQKNLEEEFRIKVNAKRKEELRCLFGPEEFDHDTPSYYWTYAQANRDLDTLLDIRRKWDLWIVPCDTPHSSGIPLDWVLPTEPSSKDWAKYLAE